MLFDKPKIQSKSTVDFGFGELRWGGSEDFYDLPNNSCLLERGAATSAELFNDLRHFLAICNEDLDRGPCLGIGVVFQDSFLVIGGMTGETTII